MELNGVAWGEAGVEVAKNGGLWWWLAGGGEMMLVGLLRSEWVYSEMVCLLFRDKIVIKKFISQTSLR